MDGRWGLNIKRVLLSKALLILLLNGVVGQRQMEYLTRGLVAIPAGTDSVMVSWRLLYSDPDNVEFNVYRKDGTGDFILQNQEPLRAATSYLDVIHPMIGESIYQVRAIVNGKEQAPFAESKTWSQPYWSVTVQTPEKYHPNDGSLGDLDGDGEYEIVVHMVGRGRDNSHAGLTSPPILHAYKMDGTLLWEINLGRNIREGAHYTQFVVYDLDGDGKAEVACKTADGTVDGKGNVIGNTDSVYVNEGDDSEQDWSSYGRRRQNGLTGYILKGPEYLSVFNGETGEVMSTVDYWPPRHPDTLYPTSDQLKEIWGDGHGNRMDRYLAAIAYLDGIHPSLVMCRGYYTRVTLAAWNFKEGKLQNIWKFDSDDGTPGNSLFHGQGNHNLAVGDVDNDGKDEIIYGSAVIDDDGTGLYSTGLGHADAMHFSDLDPTHPGLEVFNIQERFDDAGMNFRDAGTGEILWKVASVKADEEGSDKGEGPGRGVSFNVDPRYPGNECWAFGAGVHGIYSAQGKLITETTPRSCNFAVWWDGDLLREILDRTYIAKWNWEQEKLDVLFVAEDCRQNNGTKSNPVISADIFGDWREEVIFRTRDNNELRIYSTTIPTNHRFITLMQDPIYRLSIAWQNVAYNQPPHPGFYIGDDMKMPEKQNIELIKAK